MATYKRLGKGEWYVAMSGQGLLSLSVSGGTLNTNIISERQNGTRRAVQVILNEDDQIWCQECDGFMKIRELEIYEGRLTHADHLRCGDCDMTLVRPGLQVEARRS